MYYSYQLLCNILFNIFLAICMTKSTQRSSKITKNSFCISAIKNPQHLHIKDRVIVSFKSYRKMKGINRGSIIPSFNHDRKSYTRAFKLPSEFFQNDQQLIYDHQRKIVESQLQISQMLYPKPKSSHKICGVCRIFYEDYKQHVECQEHRSNLCNSIFQHYIVETADKYRQMFQKIEIQEFTEDDYARKNSMDEDIFKCLIMESVEQRTSRGELKFQSFLYE